MGGNPGSGVPLLPSLLLLLLHLPFCPEATGTPSRNSCLLRSQLTSQLTSHVASHSGAKARAHLHPLCIPPSKETRTRPPHRQAPRQHPRGVTSAPARPLPPRASLGTSPQQSMGAESAAQGAPNVPQGGFFEDISSLIPDNTPEVCTPAPSRLASPIAVLRFLNLSPKFSPSPPYVSLGPLR